MKEELTSKLKRVRGLNKERFIRFESMFDTIKNPPVEIEMTKAIISEIGMLNEKILDLFEGMIYLFELVEIPGLESADPTNLEPADPTLEPADATNLESTETANLELTTNLEPNPNEKLFQKMKEISEKEPEGYT